MNNTVDWKEIRKTQRARAVEMMTYQEWCTLRERRINRGSNASFTESGEQLADLWLVNSSNGKIWPYLMQKRAEPLLC